MGELKNKVISIGTGWMAFGYMVFPLFVYLNPHKVATTNMFLVGILLPWLILLVTGGIRLFHRESAYFTGLLLFTYLFSTALWSTHNDMNNWLDLIQYWVFSICLLNAPITVLNRFPRFSEYLLPTLFGAAVVGISFTIFDHFSDYGTTLLHRRLAGEGYTYSPISLAIHLGIAILVDWHLARSYPRYRWVLIGAAMLLLIGMLMTHSRGALLATLICIGLALYSGRRHPYTVPLAAAASILAVAVVQIIGWDYFLSRGWSFRPEIWQKTWLLAQESLVFGEGYSASSEKILMDDGRLARHSHNVLLDLLRYGGLVAVVLLLWHLFYVYRSAFSYRGLAFPLYPLILTFTLINMLFGGWYLLDKPNYYWLGYWYPIGFIIAQEIVGKHQELQT